MSKVLDKAFLESVFPPERTECNASDNFVYSVM